MKSHHASHWTSMKIFTGVCSFCWNCTEHQILRSLCSVDFHTLTLQLPIQTPHSGVCSFCWNFEWTHKNLEFRHHRMLSLNRQLQCKSVKIYWAQTSQYLALTKISAKWAHPCSTWTPSFCEFTQIFSKTSTPRS